MKMVILTMRRSNKAKVDRNHGFNFISINSDPDPDAGFDLDVKISKIL